MRSIRLHIVGASGSGTTTLGRAVADALAAPFADADDYFWLPTDPPFREVRPIAERLELMTRVFVPRASWVLSGSMAGWGDDVIALCDAVVFLTLDPAERMRRLETRERSQATTRPREEAELETFLTWARGYDDPHFDGRSRASHEAWLATLPCPVLRLDSSMGRGELRDAVVAWAASIRDNAS